MRHVLALGATILAVAANPTWAAGRRPGLCDTRAGSAAAPPYVGVFSAFPAELEPLVAATQVDQTVEADGHQFYVGRLGGVNVVLGLLGIGMLNARASAERMIANFELAALVVSGVAGSQHNIGDVVIAREWVERDLPHVWRPNRALLALAERVATRLPEPFQTCTFPPFDPEPTLVCMPHVPALVFEQRGESGDDFGDTPFPCTPGGNDIFGCELPVPLAAQKEPVVSDVVDNETAAVAHVAADAALPMIGVRAVSDGAGDPRGDRGFPAQFFDYYRLASFNAAVVTRGIVGEIGAFAADPEARRLCRRLEKRRWRAAVKLIRSAP